jgi:hypothetical protein
LAPAYQPEWLGAVERLNLSLRSAFQRVGYDRWHQSLPSILVGFRSRIHSTTGHSPHYLMFGVHPKLPCDSPSSVTPSLIARIPELSTILGHRRSLYRAVTPSSSSVRFPVGSFVLILDPRLRKASVFPKTCPRYLGPYTVKSHQPHDLYVLVDEFGQSTTVHCSRLVSYIRRSQPLAAGVSRLADVD